MREGLQLLARPAGGGDRPAGRVSPRSIATWPAWASRTCSRPSRRPSASGPACGPTTWCSTWPRSSIASATLQGPQREGHDRHAGQLPGTVRRRPREGPPAGPAGRREDGLRRQLRRHRADLLAQGRCAGARRALRHRASRPTSWRPTCGCSPAARRSKSRSRPTRSAPRRWPTSGTRCGASGSAAWPAS